MKKVLASMSKFLFAGFGIAVLALLLSLTYSALGKLFPDSFSNQMWGLVMFDIAAMCWAIAFVFQSKSTGQYAVSAIGFVVGFVGTLLMVAYEVVSSGQNIANVNAAELGRWVVYGFIAVTAIHAGLIYAHHAMSPEISEQIQIGIARGEVVSQAITDATKTIEAEKQELSRNIYHDLISQVKRDLGLHPVEGTPFEPRRYEQAIPSPTVEHSGGPDNWGPKWKASTDISPTLDAYAWACQGCGGSNAAYTRSCQYCQQPRTNGSPVTAFADLPPTPREGAPEAESQADITARAHKLGMWNPNDPNDTPFWRSRPDVHDVITKEQAKDAPKTYHELYPAPPKEDAPDAERPFRDGPQED